LYTGIVLVEPKKTPNGSKRAFNGQRYDMLAPMNYRRGLGSKSPLVFVMIAASIALTAMGQTETKPSPQTATVYVYRIKVRLVARALRPSIYFDGTELWEPCASGPVPSAVPSTPICPVRLASGEYLSHQLPIGKHTLTAGLTEVGQSFDAEPGKEYFFKLDHNIRKNVLRSAWEGREPMTLTPVSTEQARHEMEGLRKR
jgi:hypothetical protein